MEFTKLARGNTQYPVTSEMTHPVIKPAFFLPVTFGHLGVTQQTTLLAY